MWQASTNQKKAVTTIPIKEKENFGQEALLETKRDYILIKGSIFGWEAIFFPAKSKGFIIEEERKNGC